jgi:hypothetical protein
VALFPTSSAPRSLRSSFLPSKRTWLCLLNFKPCPRWSSTLTNQDSSNLSNMCRPTTLSCYLRVASTHQMHLSMWCLEVKPPYTHPLTSLILKHPNHPFCHSCPYPTAIRALQMFDLSMFAAHATSQSNFFSLQLLVLTTDWRRVL